MMPMNVDGERRDAVQEHIHMRRAAETEFEDEENRSLSDWQNAVRTLVQDAAEWNKSGDTQREYAAWVDIAVVAAARCEIISREQDGDMIYVFEIPDDVSRPAPYE